MNMKYTVFIQGYNENYEANDYEDEIATFEGKNEAEWFAVNYPFSMPLLTPHAKIVVEERDIDGEFVDVILESELK